MFCNKERIKISSFFLFSSPKMGKTDCWLPTEALAGDVVGCPLSLPENVGTFFIFVQIKKTLYKKYSDPAGFQKPFVVYAENVEETPSKFSILSRKTYLCKINRTNRL